LSSSKVYGLVNGWDISGADESHEAHYEGVAIYNFLVFFT
jgi:hypothetical protein